MTCIDCDRAVATDRYALRFDSEAREARTLDLTLCEPCLYALLADPTITMADPHRDERAVFGPDAGLTSD